MKKIYTKPSLRAEKFAFEGIMSEAPEAISAITQLYLGGNEVNVSFTDANTLGSVNYADFIN